MSGKESIKDSPCSAKFKSLSPKPNSSSARSNLSNGEESKVEDAPQEPVKREKYISPKMENQNTAALNPSDKIESVLESAKVENANQKADLLIGANAGTNPIKTEEAKATKDKTEEARTQPNTVNILTPEEEDEEDKTWVIPPDTPDRLPEDEEEERKRQQEEKKTKQKEEDEARKKLEDEKEEEEEATRKKLEEIKKEEDDDDKNNTWLFPADKLPEEVEEEKRRRQELIKKKQKEEDDARKKWEEEEALRKKNEEMERAKAEETRRHLAEVQARHALAEVGAQVAREKREIVSAAVAVFNDVDTRKQIREEMKPQEQKTTQIVSSVKKARTISDTLRLLKELKAPLLRLRVHQILQVIIVAGRYEDLLETDETQEVEATVKNKAEDNEPPKLEKLLKLIETRLVKQEKSNTTKHLDDYITTWSQFQVRSGIKTHQEINTEAEAMRCEWKRQKHLHIGNLGFGINFFQDLLSKTPSIKALDPAKKASKLNPIVENIMDYLCDIKDEVSISTYINQKGLESSLLDIQSAIELQTNELVKNTESAWTYRLNSELIEKDIKRRAILTNFMLLGEEQTAKEHVKTMEDVIQTASNFVSNDELEKLLPQLVEARVPRNQQNVRLEIVFEPSRTLKQKKEALEELSKILPGPTQLLHRPIITSSKTNIHAKFCANKEMLARLGVRAIILGEYGLEDIKFTNREDCNKIYSRYGNETADGFQPTAYFELKRGLEPYFAPIGWRRLAINIGLSPEEFWDLYSEWPIAYHGTRSKAVNSILEQGFRPSTSGCFFEELSGMHVVYLSPSIEYAGHPYYAEAVERNHKWVQVVLQVRVNPQLLVVKKPGTLPGALLTDQPADPHFQNNELEWVLSVLPGTQISGADIVVGGIMLRVSDTHPESLPQNRWWGPLSCYKR